MLSPPGPTAIHLCIDMQRLFASDGPWPTPWMERVLPIVANLVEHAPERTMFTRFIPPERPEDMAGQWRLFYQHWRPVTRAELDPERLDLMPLLARFVPPAQVHDKAVYSAFADDRLAARLRAGGVDTLIVTGAETDMCVLATVLGAVDRGYRVIVVSDAVCSSSDSGHDALLSLYRDRFSVQIEIARSDEVLAAWRG
jgi:nicotinamidase-related amidase